jgi:hypothetical protein
MEIQNFWLLANISSIRYPPQSSTCSFSFERSLLQVQHVPFFRRRLEALHGKFLFSQFADEALRQIEAISKATLEVIFLAQWIACEFFKCCSV